MYDGEEVQMAMSKFGFIARAKMSCGLTLGSFVFIEELKDTET
jgi:hypothetical protein